MQAYWPLYPMSNLMYIKSIITRNLNLQYYGFRCHGDLPYNCTLHLGQTSTYQDDV